MCPRRRRPIHDCRPSSLRFVNSWGAQVARSTIATLVRDSVSTRRRWRTRNAVIWIFSRLSTAARKRTVVFFYFSYFASRNSFSTLHSTQYYIGFPMILSLFQSTAFAREIAPNHFFLWPFRFSLWPFWNRAAFQGYCCCLMGAMCLLLHSSRSAIQFR